MHMDIKNYFSKTVHLDLIKKVYFLFHENPRLLYSVTDVCEFSDLNRKQVGFILTILVRLRMVYREIKKRGASNRYLYRAR
ncbi:hypothetical protein EV102420_07_00480 [Pseudescherichia vulneris NBRC 102420]|uniref:Uncharacterized protein n=2 Tax=Pseudescherichia vulneris TaxID=566 RepID=A0A090V1S3_PSEVU|nr:hypothetical protein EV102420_07_00480 [Pseudescherichia vulneris NBRC 102420]